MQLQQIKTKNQNHMVVKLKKKLERTGHVKNNDKFEKYKLQAEKITR